MSARAIVSGVLHKAPVSRLAKTGKPYVIATIREGSGETTRWWKAFVFAETAIEELSRLGVGDPVAVAGEFVAEIYAPRFGEPRLNWRVTADAVLSARRKRRRKSDDKSARAPKLDGPPPSLWDDPNYAGAGALNDDLPF